MAAKLRKKAARKKASRKKVARRNAPARIGRNALAELLAVNPTTVDQWRRRGVPIEESQAGPQYLVAEVVDWLRERDVEQAIASGRRADGAIDLEDLRKRRALADTELAEIALDEARGELVPREVVLEVFSDSLLRMRAKVLAMKSRYAGRWARINTAAKMKAAIEEAHLELLDELVDANSIADEAGEAGKVSRRVRAPAPARPPRGGTKKSKKTA